RDESAKKVAHINAGESALHQSRPRLEIVRHAYGGCTLDLPRQALPLLAEPFQENIAAERHTAHHEVQVGMFVDQAAHDEIEIRGLARVIEAASGVDLAVAGAKHEHVTAPSELACLLEHSVRVFRADLRLETVQNEQMRYALGDRSHPHECHMICVGSRDPLQTNMHRGAPSDHLAPDRGE